MIKISIWDSYDYSPVEQCNNEGMANEEIITMRNLVGRKGFVADDICEHLRFTASCWDDYIDSMRKVNKMLLAGVSVSEIINLLQGNRYQSCRGEDYMSCIRFNEKQVEAYEKIIGQYCTNPEEITDINIIVPNKVVEVTFADGKKEKMICSEKDTFNLRNCLFIAIAKHLYKKEYTLEGIEWKAFELTHLKKYVKIVDSALKAYDKKQKEIAKLEEKRKAEQELIKRKRAKRQAYKERRAAKRKQEEMDKQIAIQKEAYLQAMKCVEESKNVEK